MASPEVVEPSGTLNSSYPEEFSAPEGWKKKLVLRKAGTPKKKDVVYFAPSGDEIRSKRQLEKYLKNHPGGPPVSDFDWTTGETPRRSARLSTKGRLSSDSTEAEPAPKRTKVDSDDETVIVRPSRKTSKRKLEPQTDGAVKDDVMEDAEKAEGDNTSADCVEASSDAKPEEEKEVPTDNETVENNVDEIHEGAEVKLSSPEEKVPDGEGIASAGNSTDKGWRGCGKSKTRVSRKLGRANEILVKCSPVASSFICDGTKRPWDPTDSSHVLAVKTALHLSAVPNTILCRETEQKNVIDFCKACIMGQQAGSMYICGCPGTGKSLTIEKVKLLCTNWTEEAGTLCPEIVGINCTSLTDPKHIYLRLLQAITPDYSREELNKSDDFVIRKLKQLMCDSKASKDKSSRRMLLLIVDEMDYLITRDQSVLYELFRLATLASSRLILIGVANAIDLTDRLLPKLQSMNCKVDVITFRAYTKDQILAVLQQRLLELPYYVFQPAALELCARKVAAATGDMRKALDVCRSAIELLESDAHDEPGDEADAPMVFCGGEVRQGSVNHAEKQASEPTLVRIDVMARALSRVFRSPVVETIQLLPRHQQIVLCAAAQRFRHGKKDSSLGELNTGYLEFCKSTGMQALAAPEFSSVCRVLADQALLTIGTSREDRLRRVALKVDREDLIFALQGIRIFRNCLQ